MANPTEATGATLQELCAPLLNRWGAYRLTRDPITATAIQRFCEVAQDGNPVYWDEEFARRSRFGRLIAPPQSLFAMTFAAWWTPDHVEERLARDTVLLNEGSLVDLRSVHGLCEQLHREYGRRAGS
jgi:hypothetical protein